MPKVTLRDDLAKRLPMPHRALLRALRRHANKAGKTTTEADEVYYDIVWAIERLENRVLREGKSGERKRIITKVPPTSPGDEPLGYIERMVRIKAHVLGIGQRRTNEAAAWSKVMDQDDDPMLTKIEKRAVAIVRGAPRKANKNFAEIDAIRLADRVLAHWWLPAKPRGRPTGRRIVRDSGMLSYDLKLTMLETIAATLAIIDQLAPGSSTDPESTLVEVVVEVLRTAGIIKPGAEIDDLRISNIVRKLRRGT
jgi:hypothetical protein